MKTGPLWKKYFVKTRLTLALLCFTVVLCGGGLLALRYFNQQLARPQKRAEPNRQLPLKYQAKLGPTKTAGESAPKIIYVTNQFNWSQVESSDYRKYIANLRAVGCPESTIRDIILTDILKLYAAQRGQFYHNGREFKFWETDEKRKLNAKQLEERETRLAAIDKEIPSVLRELLGINYEREINKYFVDTNDDERRLNFLSEDKRAEILALRDESEAMKERIVEAANGKLSAADIAALKQIEAQRQSQLEGLLSASELAEFELRTSPVADELRARLVGFNPTEAEFRQIFEMEKAVSEKFGYLDEKDATVASDKAAAEKAIDDEIKRQWGDARYAEFSRAQDPDYRDAFVFAEVYELPVSTAQTLFEIKQIAEGEKNNLLSRGDIPEGQRLEALRAIQNETEKNLRATLGAKAYSSYAQSSGRWIQKLGRN